MKKTELKSLIREEIKKVVKESKIVHKTVGGETRTLDINLSEFDNFLKQLRPVTGRDYKITPKVREDIISYIIKYLDGYSITGGGVIKIK